MTDTREVINIGTPDHMLDVTMNEDGVNADLLDVDEPARYSKRQLELAHEVGEIVAECGQYDQSWGPNGAYYVEGRDNPWQANGLNCANCVSYEGPRACEWVAGTIDPDGLCKLSVIPADLVVDAPLASTASTASPNGPTTTEDAAGEAEMPRSRQTPVESRKSHGKTVEFRQVTIPVTLEERATDAPGDQPVRFSGYAAVFNSPSERLWDRANGEFTELIAPGAFKRTLARDNDVRMYLNHNSDMVLASTRSGTLNLAEDDRGLKVDAELPNTSYAQDLAELMRSGVVDSMSFGFQVPANGDSWEDDTRTLHEIALHEVSVVTGFPAYPDTAGAAVRSNDTADDTEAALPLDLAQRYHQLYSHQR